MKALLTPVLSVILLGCTPAVPNKTSIHVLPNLSSVLMDKDNGCMEGSLEQFGRYIGDWDIQDWSLDKDGKTWNKGKGARWNFTCVGNGIAIQDFWMPNGGGAGTNLRMYDPKAKRWEIAWTSTGNPGFSHIRATEDRNGNIVMLYVSPEQIPPRRITFMKPNEAGWDWKLEMELPSADSKAWHEVYRIKATKRSE